MLLRVTSYLRGVTVEQFLWIIVSVCLNFSHGQPGGQPGSQGPGQPPPNPPPPSDPNPPPNPSPPPGPNPVPPPTPTHLPTSTSIPTIGLDPLCSFAQCPSDNRGNTKFPMANNCTAYYECDGKSSVKIKYCTNSLFDKNTGTCTATTDTSICLRCPTSGLLPTYSSTASSSTVEARTSLKTSPSRNVSSTSDARLDPLCASEICPSTSGRNYFPMANNCTAYYVCAGNSPVLKLGTCDPPKLFDKNVLNCVDTTDTSVCLLCPTTEPLPTYSSTASSSTVETRTSVKTSPNSNPTSDARLSVPSSTVETMTSLGASLVLNVSSNPTTSDASSSSTTKDNAHIISLVSNSESEISLKSETSTSHPTFSMLESTTSSSVLKDIFLSSSTIASGTSDVAYSQSSSRLYTDSSVTSTSGNKIDSVTPSVTVSPTSTSAIGIELNTSSTSSVTVTLSSTNASSVAVPSSYSTNTGKTSDFSSSSVPGSGAASPPSSITSSTSTPQTRQIYFSKKPSGVTVEGNAAMFECTFVWSTDIGGSARPDKFLWVLNGKELVQTGRITIDGPTELSPKGYFRSVLRFSPTLSTDSGNLTCCAVTGDFMNATTTFYVVIGKPRVTIAPEFISARSNDSIAMSCSVSVASDVNASLISVNRITWLRDGQMTSFKREFKNSSFPVTSILNTSLLQSTNVTCFVETSLVNISSGVSFVHIISNDQVAGCQPEIADNVDWSFTEVDESNFGPCPENKTGIAVRLCLAANRWAPPDLSRCISQEFVNLKQQVDMIQNRNTGIDNQTMSNLTEIISNIVTNPANMTMAEFQLIVQIIGDMADIRSTLPPSVVLDKQELLSMMKTVDVLLSVPDSGKFTENLAVLLLSSVDTYSSLYAKQSYSDSVFFMSKSLVLETGGLPSQAAMVANNDVPWKIPSWDKTNWTSPDSSLWAEERDNSIMITYTKNEQTFDLSGTLNYTSSCIKNIGHLMPLTADQIKKNSYINSVLVSLTIIGLNSANPRYPPITISLEHLQPNKSMTGQCVYWNFSSANNGSWMNDDCKTLHTNETHTTCNCSHLTNFAILMSLSPTENVVLSIISMVGCIVSVVALVMTILLYASQWKKMKSRRAVVLINLCIALIVANVVFLAGSNRTESEIGCKVVAALLHYFFLTAFFLMLLEGILLFIYVICVFYVHRMAHTVVLLFSAWFIPAVIVAVSLGVTKTVGYGTTSTCWLSVDLNLIWAFVGPALFVILVNIIIMVVVLIRIANAKVRSDLKKKRNKIFSVLRNVVILSPILGVTWVFGVLSVNEKTEVFQYIFTIANSLQGLFIFVLHGLCHAKNKRSSTSSKPKRWTGPPSKIAAHQNQIQLVDGDSQENLVNTTKGEKELYLEQNILKGNSVNKVPFGHQLSNMSHASNGTAQTYMSNTLSTSGISSQH